LNICNAILVAKSELEWPEGVECASVDPYLLLQRLLDEFALIERYLSFSGHCDLVQRTRAGVVGEMAAVRDVTLENAAGKSEPATDP
jgi:hypothetical protein